VFGKSVILWASLATGGMALGLCLIAVNTGARSSGTETPLPALPDQFELIDVPYLHQKTDRDCVATSLRMLLDFRKTKVNEADLRERLRTGSVPGAHLFKACQFLKGKTSPICNHRLW